MLPAQALALAGIITLGAMLDHGLFYGLGRPGAWLAYAVVVDAADGGDDRRRRRWGLAGVAVGFVLVAIAATVARWVLVGRLARAAAADDGAAVPHGHGARPSVDLILGTLVLAALAARAGSPRSPSPPPSRSPWTSSCSGCSPAASSATP